MNAKQPATLSPRPQLFSSLRRGFDAVASHIGLILLPVLLDLFLWLGPHYGIKTIAASIQENLTRMTADAGQFSSMLQASQQMWDQIGERFNLALLLRTYPVGVPSLMAGRFPIETPLGSPAVYQVQSTGESILWILAFAVIGIALGSQYFNAIARTVTPASASIQFASPGRSTVQVILLSLAVLAILIIISIPALILLSIVALISPAVGQVAMLVFTLLLIWILVPLVFSPHGIFIFRQNALSSMLTSMRLVRFILPAVSIFLMGVVLLNQGMDLLWETPELTSWLSLVGIGGHAFITTALLASSFIFYQDAVQWVQETLQRNLWKGNKTIQA